MGDDNMFSRFGVLFGFYVAVQVLSYIDCLPTTTPSFVVSTTEQAIESVGTTEDNVDTKEGNAGLSIPKIYEMKIFANVSNRFAHTSVTSKVKNIASNAQEATFSVILPENAYISGFVMEIGGQSYKAYIKEKEEAKQEYDEAVASGRGAAHVAASARDSNRFVVSTNVEPQSKAVFHLFYEELLQRNDGQYDIVLNIHPGQPVKNLDVEVLINESRPLKFVKTSPIRSGNEIDKYKEELDPRADINMINSTAASVKFMPNAERQKQLAQSLGKDAKEGLAGQFVVHYEVERDPVGGEVLLNDGYFVHFFAPSDLPPLPKQVVFVLDTSGSMYDRKLEQLKEAMYSILGELKDDDFFNIVEFNTNVKVWDLDQNDKSVHYPSIGDNWYSNESPVDINNLTLPSAYSASEDNKMKAKEVIKKLDSNGGTNIYEALRIGLHLVKLMKSKMAKPPQPLIVFLTDGDPTVGISDTETIVNKISVLNSESGKSPIFSLSFGDGADKSFLQKLALRNLGFSRHIYEAADSSLQLQNFYKQISSPLLSNVKFLYTSDASKLTKTEFPILFSGSELIVAGHYDASKEFSELPKISGWGVHGPIDMIPKKLDKPVSDLERLWAYLTVKQILEARDAASNKTVYEKKALDLALKYSFVTPVSSLVVVKPNATKAVNTEVADRGGYERSITSALSSLPSQPHTYVSYRKGSVHFSRFGGGGGGGFVQNHGLISSFASPLPQQSYNSPAIPLAFGGKIGSFASAPVPEVQIADFDEPEGILGPTVSSIADDSVSTTVSNTADVIDTLNTSLPWLQSILNKDLIATPSGDLKLGDLATVIADTPKCSNSVNNSTGNCSLLFNCPQMFKILTDVDVYYQHFCLINNEYAGVCCSDVEAQAIV